MNPPCFFRLSAVSLGVEYDRGIEEGEERDQCAAYSTMIEMVAPWPTNAVTVVSHAGDPCPAEKLATVIGRSSSERLGEDRRDDTGRVDLQRQMRGIALEHAIAYLPLGILDQMRRRWARSTINDAMQ